MTAATRTLTAGAAWMHAGLILLAAVAGAIVAIAILSVVGSARGKRTPPRHQRFSADTEAAIRQNMRLFGRRRHIARPTQAEVDMQIARMELDEYGHRRDGAR